jgi:hypothetical protein
MKSILQLLVELAVAAELISIWDNRQISLLQRVGPQIHFQKIKTRVTCLATIIIMVIMEIVGGIITNKNSENSSIGRMMSNLVAVVLFTIKTMNGLENML